MAEAKLKVILRRATPDADDVTAMAARRCYSRMDVEALRERSGEPGRAHVGVAVHFRGRARDRRLDAGQRTG